MPTENYMATVIASQNDLDENVDKYEAFWPAVVSPQNDDKLLCATFGAQKIPMPCKISEE